MQDDYNYKDRDLTLKKNGDNIEVYELTKKRGGGTLYTELYRVGKKLGTLE